MNSNTKEALKDFATAVQKLAISTVLTIGEKEAGDICDVAETLKDCLNKDETIP